MSAFQIVDDNDEPILLPPRVDERFEADVETRLQGMRAAHEAKKRFAAEQMEERNTRVQGVRRMDGDAFLYDLPEHPPVLWGTGDDALWMAGEGTLLVGGDGVGKTTLAQQLILARVGVRDDLLLDHPVQPVDGRVLYLAMDRPRQAQRSFARMVAGQRRKKHGDALRDRLAVWLGPLPVDPLSAPDALANWLHDEFGPVSDVVVDSYKDLAPGLSDDAVGAAVNSAAQEVLARGINWLGLHHQRKASGENKTPRELSDVFGSRWLTAGMGNVLMVVGDAGDQTVELRHLKPSLRQVPPMLVRHDHARGVSTLVQGDRLPEEVLADAGDEGATIRDVAEQAYGVVNRATELKANRALKKLVREGKAHEVAAKSGGKGGSRPARYFAVQEA
jgi:hypothetical protein